MLLGSLRRSIWATVATCGVACMASAGTVIPTGQTVTPLAVPGAVQQRLNPGYPGYPNFGAGEAVRSQVSPDGKTLAVLCAGFNSNFSIASLLSVGGADPAASTQLIFLYDISGTNAASPKLAQVLQQQNAHVGLVFSGNNTLYATGGSDDAVYVYQRSQGKFVQTAKIALGHKAGIGLFGVEPNAAGLALSADGKTLVVANNYNDSISVIDTITNTVRYEQDLRPFANEGSNGQAGGTYPFAVAIKGNSVAYVSSDRDREIDVVALSTTNRPNTAIQRIRLKGNALGLTLDAAQQNLYVAEDNADEVSVIDTSSNTIVKRIDTRGPASVTARLRNYTGAAPFSSRLSADGTTLYVANAGSNSVAVVPLIGPNAFKVKGLIPTDYEPHDVSFGGNGRYLYIINGKSATGPNSGFLYGDTDKLAYTTYPGGNFNALLGAAINNQYQFQLERATLVAAPVPTDDVLERLTAQVARNNYYDEAGDKVDPRIEFLKKRIHHIVYIVKENRTFDQVLGDLGNGSNGNPSLAVFGKLVTPNLHAVATNFVTLDNFRNPGDGSMDGWGWATQGRVPNTQTLTQQINYAFVDRGLSYDGEGANRNVPSMLPTVAQRNVVAANAPGLYSNFASQQPGGVDNLLAGTGNHSAPDAPFGAQKGYIFDAVLNAGKTVRNYGFETNNLADAQYLRSPGVAQAVQAQPLMPSLIGNTDVYYRNFDQSYPDLWLFEEWKREFDGYVANGNLPALELVRLSHDHTGSFGNANSVANGLATPELEVADNDYATAKVIDAIAHSRYAADTLIFVVEDDAQDGPDHVESHRGTAYVVGPYVKQHAVVSTQYGQVNMLRTIEDILGTEHLNLNTARQPAMGDVFDVTTNGQWTFSAAASDYLVGAPAYAPLQTGEVRFVSGTAIPSSHDASWWAQQTVGFDFSNADAVEPALYNRVLWQGLKGDEPYPESAAGDDDGE